MNSLRVWAAILAWGAMQLFSTAVANPATQSGGRASAQLLTEGGSPLPNVPLRVVSFGRIPRDVAEDGTVLLALSANLGTTPFAVEGLPPGYFLKTVEYGGKTFNPGSVVVDGKSSLNFVLTLGFEPVSTLQRANARGKVLNIPSELNATSLSLTSTLPGGPTVVVLLAPDRSFEFSNIPIGAYRVGVRDAAGNAFVSWTVAVIRDTVSDLMIDLRNNPFPEFERTSPTISPFTGGKLVEITGVVTQKLTPIRQPNTAVYFRMDVKDERTGAVTPWAVHVEKDWQVPNIHAGDTLTVPGTVSTDGTNRLSARPF